MSNKKIVIRSHKAKLLKDCNLTDTMNLLIHETTWVITTRKLEKQFARNITTTLLPPEVNRFKKQLGTTGKKCKLHLQLLLECNTIFVVYDDATYF